MKQPEAFNTYFPRSIASAISQVFPGGKAAELAAQEHNEWCLSQFGKATEQWQEIAPAVGVVEELGELGRAILKSAQGIRGTHAEHAEAALDALGDVLLYVNDLFSRNQLEWSFTDLLYEGCKNAAAPPGHRDDALLTARVMQQFLAVQSAARALWSAECRRVEVVDFFKRLQELAWALLDVWLPCAFVHTWRTVVSKRAWKENSKDGTSQAVKTELEVVREDDKGVADAAQAIDDECAALAALLKEKNRRYGNSVFEPQRVFAKGASVEMLIAARADDKVARIVSQQEDDTEDAELDLLGYLLLKRAYPRYKQRRLSM